jgi:Tol biopolymer transport system component
VAAIALLALSALALPGAASALPAGPRLAFLEVQFPPQRSNPKAAAKVAQGKIRIASIDAAGHDRKVMVTTPGVEPIPFGTLSWSGDGERLAFLGRPAGAKGGSKAPKIRAYVVDADGSGLHAVPGTIGTVVAAISPDGESVAFTRKRERHSKLPKLHPKDPGKTIEELENFHKGYESLSTWIAPVGGGKARRVTKWENERFAEPTSFSPDGRLLAVTMRPPGGREEIDTVDLASGATKTIEVEGADAAFSPDGTRIAFTSFRDRESISGFDGPEATSELYVANADGSGAKRITNTPELEETGPSWDPSGNRIGYLREPGGFLNFLGIEAELMEVNADGRCSTAVAKPKPTGAGQASVQPPSWRPGEGRGVEPLSC